jgi:hypothetical protein
MKKYIENTSLVREVNVPENIVHLNHREQEMIENNEC